MSDEILSRNKVSDLPGAVENGDRNYYKSALKNLRIFRKIIENGDIAL